MRHIHGGRSLKPREPEAERGELVLDPQDPYTPNPAEPLIPYGGDAGEKERLEIS